MVVSTVTTKVSLEQLISNTDSVNFTNVVSKCEDSLKVLCNLIAQTRSRFELNMLFHVEGVCFVQKEPKMYPSKLTG